MLLAEAPLRDVAVDEEFELDIGDSPDVQVRAVHAQGETRVEIRNATNTAIAFELTLHLAEDTRLSSADPAARTRNGRPHFELTIPAAGSVEVRYRTEHKRIRGATR